MEQLVRNLLDELSAFDLDNLDLEDLEPVIGVFCKHRRLLRLLLTLCSED